MAERTHPATPIVTLGSGAETGAGWRQTAMPAQLGEVLADGSVRCHLSPRHCVIRAGRQGFCGVRVNRGGRLMTLNYGKGVHATEETIETEAVNHYAPGEPILSMGNIGCMLNCAYCHNWKTSQAKYVSDHDVYAYSPEDVVAIALRHGIRVLSWTYNDPVVWHEFVVDTAKIARQAGLINLYKSAFFIAPEAVDELLPHIDIFSISIKSMDPEYYRRITKGTLQPVLDATKQVHRAGKHVELSTLMITGLSDDEETARRIVDWVLRELSDTVPLHFVRFHPDYRMRNAVRTPVPRLIRAREVAREMGAQHVYLGNVYDTPWSDTACNGCGALLVERYGLHARVCGLDARGRCAACGRDAHVTLLPRTAPVATVAAIPPGWTAKRFDWRGDVRAIHVRARNRGVTPTTIYVRHVRGEVAPAWRPTRLAPGESYRFIVAKGGPDERGCAIALHPLVESNLHEVFDRAHYPTLSVEDAGVAQTDISPLPAWS